MSRVADRSGKGDAPHHITARAGVEKYRFIIRILHNLSQIQKIGVSAGGTSTLFDFGSGAGAAS
jgi:hypothetical protein